MVSPCHRHGLGCTVGMNADECDAFWIRAASDCHSACRGSSGAFALVITCAGEEVVLLLMWEHFVRL
jgi:hypothetical protein